MRWFAILIPVFLCGCTTTKYVPVESVRTERAEATKWRVDTIIQGDTRIVYIKGDTVIDRRDRWLERIKEVHDTLYIERTDSIAVPYPVEEELSGWERIKSDWGGLAIAAVAVAALSAAGWVGRRLKKKRD